MVASKWKVFNCLWVIALALGIIGVLCGIIAAVIGRRYRIQVPEDVALQCKRPGWAVVPALASHMLSAIIAVLLRASVPVASKCVRTRWVIASLVYLALYGFLLCKTWFWTRSCELATYLMSVVGVLIAAGICFTGFNAYIMRKPRRYYWEGISV
ncbi:unnamed protein product [Cuscuta epithymum]|uniref:Uncharacterized protein n=1 Tax=Cuscuta epithymum TaxID=186058 RepID=A0AAV0C9M9_9ASTE|nr:unnamed protein product [Cuscuta epithymum]